MLPIYFQNSLSNSCLLMYLFAFVRYLCDSMFKSFTHVQCRKMQAGCWLRFWSAAPEPPSHRVTSTVVHRGEYFQAMVRRIDHVKTPVSFRLVAFERPLPTRISPEGLLPGLQIFHNTVKMAVRNLEGIMTRGVLPSLSYQDCRLIGKLNAEEEIGNGAICRNCRRQI